MDERTLGSCSVQDITPYHMNSILVVHIYVYRHIHIVSVYI